METIQGRGTPPAIVLSYVRRLPDTSLTVALASGGREFFGWGEDRYLAAEIHDALNLNTKVSRDWEKPPSLPLYRRPGDPPPGEKKKVTVFDVFRRFTATPSPNRKD